MNPEEHSLRAFLQERFASFDVQCADSADLAGVIDSLGLFDVVEFIEREFGVEVAAADFNPQRFASIRSMLDFIDELRSRD